MLKQCNIIEFLNVEGEIRIRIYERLKNVFGDATVGPLLWWICRRLILTQKVYHQMEELAVKRQEIVLFYDNAASHTTQYTTDNIAEFGWAVTVLPHPPYSPDLTHSKFRLLGPLKELFMGILRTFRSLKCHSLVAWKQVQYFYYAGIQILLHECFLSFCHTDSKSFAHTEKSTPAYPFKVIKC